jgi:hypothetical protein
MHDILPNKEMVNQGTHGKAGKELHFTKIVLNVSETILKMLSNDTQSVND